MAGRVRGDEFAARVNAAAELLAGDVEVSDAARELAGRFGCSQRQARRYLEQAADSGPVAVPERTAVFTVRLPVQLVGRVRAHAAGTGHTISAVVAQALEEFLSRRRRERPGR